MWEGRVDGTRMIEKMIVSNWGTFSPSAESPMVGADVKP
jgi:hypothetical protein